MHSYRRGAPTDEVSGASELLQFAPASPELSKLRLLPKRSRLLKLSAGLSQTGSFHSARLGPWQLSSCRTRPEVWAVVFSISLPAVLCGRRARYCFTSNKAIALSPLLQIVVARARLLASTAVLPAPADSQSCTGAMLRHGKITKRHRGLYELSAFCGH